MQDPTSRTLPSLPSRKPDTRMPPARALALLLSLTTFATLSASLAGCVHASVHTGSTASQASVTTSVAPSTIGLQHDAALAALLGDIDPARMRATDSVLVSFGTRHTMSDTASETRGVGAARRWIFSRLSDVSRDCGGCLRVEYDPAMVTVTRHPQKPQVNVVNVLAWLPGRDTSRVVVIGGHYDSCSCSIDGLRDGKSLERRIASDAWNCARRNRSIGRARCGDNKEDGAREEGDAAPPVGAFLVP